MKKPDDAGTDAAARVGAIRKFVIDYIASAQLGAGKKFSDVEITKHVDQVFLKTDVVHNT